MDIEFHYYITCIIALRAGFSPDDSGVIAYSCQYVDDNTDEEKGKKKGTGYFTDSGE